MNAILSDSRDYVLVFVEGEDEPEEYTLSEFVEIFGEEELEKLQEAHQVVDVTEITAYYDALIGFLRADGQYAHDLKLLSNCSESEKAKRVLSTYYRSDLQRLMGHLNVRKSEVTSATKKLNFWSQRIQLGEIPLKNGGTQISIEEIRNLFYRKPCVRERMAEKAKAHQKNGEPYSVQEILIESLTSFRKIKYRGEGKRPRELIKLAHDVL